MDITESKSRDEIVLLLYYYRTLNLNMKLKINISQGVFVNIVSELQNMFFDHFLLKHWLVKYN